MRSMLAAVLGTALMVAVATPSLADPVRIMPSEGGAGGHQGGGHGFGGPSRGAGPGRFGGQGGQGGQGFQGGNGGYRHNGGGHGVAVGAGIAGLAAGALIGGAIANQGNYYPDDGYGYGYSTSPYGYGAPAYAPGPVADEEDIAPEASGSDAVAYCAQRYRSYDPRSGTYVGYDGERHPCP